MANAIDVVGKTFNYWTVIRNIERPSTRASYIECRCKCGKIREVNKSNVTSGKSTSCGCFKREQATSAVRVPMLGRKFGLLTVTSRADNIASNRAWLCTCDCGGSTIVRGTSLRRGDTKSCGCMSFVWLKDAFSKPNRDTREYKIFCGLKDRCLNVNNHAYPRYGGRGIAVCDAWVNSFDTFYADMGAAPSTDYTLDRIDNNRGYNPDNCRWATYEQQANNARSNVTVTALGRTMTVAQWSRFSGIKAPTIYRRLYAGWSEEDAVTVHV